MCRPGRDGHGRFGSPARSHRGNHEAARQRRLLPESSFRGCRRPSRAGLAAVRSLKGPRSGGFPQRPGSVAGAGRGRSGSGPDDRVRQNGVNTLKGVARLRPDCRGIEQQGGVEAFDRESPAGQGGADSLVTGIRRRGRNCRSSRRSRHPFHRSGRKGFRPHCPAATPAERRPWPRTARDFPGCGAATSARRHRERGSPPDPSSRMKSGITAAPLSTARWRAGLSARRRSWRNQTMAGEGNVIPMDRECEEGRPSADQPTYASTWVRQSNCRRSDRLIDMPPAPGPVPAGRWGRRTAARCRSSALRSGGRAGVPGRGPARSGRPYRRRTTA